MLPALVSVPAVSPATATSPAASKPRRSAKRTRCRGGRRLSIVALFGVLVALGATQAVPSAAAVHLTAWTKATSISAKKLRNGDVVVEAVYMSSNRHCLEVGRWKQGVSGMQQVEAFPYGLGRAFGGSNQGFLLPYKLEHLTYTGRGTSPWVWRWRAVWPAKVLVHDERGKNFTISEATRFSGVIHNPAPRIYSEWRYKEGGKTYVVDCEGPGSRPYKQVFRQPIEGDGPVSTEGPPPRH
jgi:hypothetical protein